MPSPLDRACSIWLLEQLTKRCPVEHCGSVISPFAPWCGIYECDSEVHFQSLQASTNGFGKGDFNARSSAVVHNSTAAELVASFLTEDIVDSANSQVHCIPTTVT